MRERVLARIAAGGRLPRSGPLYDLVLALNLLDPDAPSFKARSCRSLHDTIRFMHEMSVRSMFDFGDEQKKGWKKKGCRLQTSIPMDFYVIDLDRSAPTTPKAVAPDQIESTPFHALWRGFAGERLPWPQRWNREMMGFSRDFQDTVLGAHRGPRRPGSANYLMVARDYLNLNARFAYHYTMVDAIVGPGSENNHVYFTFRSGGASTEQRTRRLRFLEVVLRNLRFEVDRRGDTLIAWLRRYSASDTELSLERLGRLIVCSRELDAALRNDAWVRMYAQYFLDEKYGFFT
jgi:pyruvate,water dikinase